MRETRSRARGRLLIIERFSEKAWSPFARVRIERGESVTLETGPSCRGLAREAIRAAVQFLRDDPIEQLTAEIPVEDRERRALFESAGFRPAGANERSALYIFALRGDSVPYNVWI